MCNLAVRRSPVLFLTSPGIFLRSFPFWKHHIIVFCCLWIERMISTFFAFRLLAALFGLRSLWFCCIIWPWLRVCHIVEMLSNEILKNPVQFWISVCHFRISCFFLLKDFHYLVYELILLSVLKISWTLCNILARFITTSNVALLALFFRLEQRFSLPSLYWLSLFVRWLYLILYWVEYFWSLRFDRFYYLSLLFSWTWF